MYIGPEITAKIVALWVLLWTDYPMILGPVVLNSGKAMGLWAFLYVSYTIALPLACHVCQENALSWPGSGGVMLGVACLGGVVSWALWIIIYITAGMASILIPVPIAAVVYAAVIPGVTFRKGMLIYVVQCLLVLTSALVLFFGYVLCFGAL